MIMKNRIKALVDELTVRLDEQKAKGRPACYCYYTTLSTLATMLVNDKLRLSDAKSLTINDLREPCEYGEKKKWQCLRVACFTSGRAENNAMWGCYGKPRDESIMIRIPRSVMADLLCAQMYSKKRRNSFDLKWGMLGNTKDVSRGYEIVGDDVKRSFHDVAYFDDPVDDAEDEDKESRNQIRLEMYRKYQQMEKPLLLGRSFALSEQNALIGYLKRIQWQYENETRLHFEVPEQHKNKELYLQLPKDFFRKISIVLGPDFNIEKKKIKRFAVSARKVLTEFMRRTEGARKNKVHIYESEYFGHLNYRGTAKSNKVSHLSFDYKGVQVIRRGRRQKSLVERCCELGADIG